jgi:tetratricopeptide (TPR) repeat protein
MKPLWKRFLVFFCLLAIPAAVGGGVYWQRRHSLPAQLAQVRPAVGTRQAGPILEGLAADYPDSTEVWFLRGRQARLWAQLDAGRIYLRRAKELGWPEAQVERENLLLLSQSDFRKAEPQLETWLEVNPNDSDARLALALGFLRQGHLDQAEARVNQILEAHPEYGAARWVRGKIRLARRQEDQAAEDFAEALRLGPGQYYERDARLSRAICLLDLGRFAEAQTLFRRCHEDEPDNPKALYGMGRCARFLNRPDEAAEAFQAVLRLRPEHVESLLQLAHVREAQGELKQSLDLLEQAEKLDSTYLEVPFQMAKILNALGETSRAEKSQARYLEMRERWLKRKPGQSLEEIFHPRNEDAFPTNLDK